VRELRFTAGLHRVERGSREATFYVMNTGVNRNRWAVTDAALEEALPTILGRPLGCGPGYATDRHYGDPVRLGVFTSTLKPDGYALGTAVVEDDEAWARLTGGMWGPVSVVVSSRRESCSACGADLTGGDPYSHGCVASGEGYVVVESFTFDRVDFVDEPAYPQAGLIRAVDTVVPLSLLAGLYSSQSNVDRGPEPVARAGLNSGCGEMKPGLKQTDIEQQIRQLEEERDRLRGQVTGLAGELDSVHAERRRELVEEAMAARRLAGLSRDDDDETLSGMDEAGLRLVAEDAARLVRAPGPKARRGAAEADPLKAAMDEARLRLFGRRT